MRSNPEANVLVSRGDVEELRVAARPGSPSVDVRVYDHDSDEVPLITAQLYPAEAVRLARALLQAAHACGHAVGWSITDL